MHEGVIKSDIFKYFYQSSKMTFHCDILVVQLATSAVCVLHVSVHTDPGARHLVT